MENNENLIQKTNVSKTENKTLFKIIFLMFGLGTLLSWNAILSDIDYFNAKQKKFIPDVSFGFLNIFPNVIFQFIILAQKEKSLKFKPKLMIGLTISILLLSVIPFTVSPFDNDSLISFILTAFVIVLNGLVSAVLSSGFFGLASYFPTEYIVWLSGGQGFSGILMNLIQYICIALIESQTTRTIIFFGISGVILVGTLFCLIYAYRTDFFREKLSKTADFEDISNNESDKSEGGIENNVQNFNSELVENSENNDNSNLKEDEMKDNKHIKNLSSVIDTQYNLKYIIKKLMVLNLMTAYVYVVTFALFPAVTINQPMFNFKEYTVITLITIYNFFDTVGRYLVDLMTPTKFKAYLWTLIRSMFLILLPLNYYLSFKTSNQAILKIISIVLVGSMGLTNGIAATLCFAIAPSFLEGKLKGKAGNSISLFFIIGILLGTLVAFGSKAWLEWVKPENDL